MLTPFRRPTGVQRVLRATGPYAFVVHAGVLLCFAACGGLADSSEVGVEAGGDDDPGASAMPTSPALEANSLISGSAGAPNGEPREVTPTPDEPSDYVPCKAELSPSEVVLNGELLFGQFQLQPSQCRSQLGLHLNTCPLDNRPTVNCIQLSARMGTGSAPLGEGTRYDVNGLAHQLEVTGGAVDRAALTAEGVFQGTFSGTTTFPGGMTAPFELRIGGCPQPLQVCLI